MVSVFTLDTEEIEMISPHQRSSDSEAERLYRQAVKDHAAARIAYAYHEPIEMSRFRGTGELFGIMANEVVLAFNDGTTPQERQAFLDQNGMRIIRPVWEPTQIYVAEYQSDRRDAAGTVSRSRELKSRSDVVHFVLPVVMGQIKPSSVFDFSPDQWHLSTAGVDAAGAWEQLNHVDVSDISVAILDDGVEVDHEDLKAFIDRQFARDFYLSGVGHADARPKNFNPNDLHDSRTNDVHGTPCAGLIGAKNADIEGKALGVAHGCALLPIRMRTRDNLVPNDKVIAAFMHAATHSDILSCSWFTDRTYKETMDNILGMLSAGHRTFKRGLLGTPVFISAGNRVSSEDDNSVVIPGSLCANHESGICVSAITSGDQLAEYSCFGPPVWVCAPGGARRNVAADGVSFTTSDVIPLPMEQWGFFAGVGEPDRSDQFGQWTNEFCGTSAATPITAGVAALMLAGNRNLPLSRLRAILAETSDKIDTLTGAYDARGRSDKYGYGKVNARKAVRAAIQEGAVS